MKPRPQLFWTPVFLAGGVSLKEPGRRRSMNETQERILNQVLEACERAQKDHVAICPRFWGITTMPNGKYVASYKQCVCPGGAFLLGRLPTGDSCYGSLARALDISMLSSQGIVCGFDSLHIPKDKLMSNEDYVLGFEIGQELRKRLGIRY